MERRGGTEVARGSRISITSSNGFSDVDQSEYRGTLVCYQLTRERERERESGKKRRRPTEVMLVVS